MGRNRLKLNKDKTQIIWIRTRQQLAKVSSKPVGRCSSSTRNSICRTTLHSFAARVTFNCSSYVIYDVRRRQTQLRRSYMFSLAAVWISAKIFWLVYATMYWGNCSQSEMPLLAWLPTHENSNHFTPVLRDLHWLAVRQRIVFKPPCWSTSVCVVWRLRIWVSFDDQFQLFWAVNSCGLAPPAFFTSQEQRRPLVAGVSWSPVQSHGTVYLLSWEHSNCLFRLVPSVWRLISTDIVWSLQRTCWYLVSNLHCI